MSSGEDEPEEPPEGEESAGAGDVAETPEADAGGTEGEADDEAVGTASFADLLGEAESAVAGASAEDAGGEALERVLDAVEAAVEAAGTEAELDAVEGALDDAASAIGAADLPEPDEDDEEAADPRAELEARLEDLRSAAEERRGPYAEDVVEAVGAAATTLSEGDWTDDGRSDLGPAVEAFLDRVADAIGDDLGTTGNDPAALADAVESAAASVEVADLDPDDDAGTIAALLDATDALVADLEAAEEWEDLTTREQLEAHGFYDVLDHVKDYPPEWHALKVHEKRGNVDMILLAFDLLEADFMEGHCLEALRRMGDEAAVPAMLELAERRNRDAIEVLGKIGSDEPVPTFLEYVDVDSDPALQKVTLKALGEIGSEEATGAVANKLVTENESVRSAAARALGLIGDPRAVDPLADALETDESDTVRGSAAWALVQIGTAEALEAAATHAGDRSPLVQSEARAAERALAS